MQLSWNGLKISIAGARLSHLVQKDKIWDHGSMTEQVRNIFYQWEKAKHKKNADALRKYSTPQAFAELEQQMKKIEADTNAKNRVLTNVAIIQVHAATAKTAERFTALIKGKRTIMKNVLTQTENHGNDMFSEKWLFVRDGDWWLLDGIQTHKRFL